MKSPGELLFFVFIETIFNCSTHKLTLGVMPQNFRHAMG